MKEHPMICADAEMRAFLDGRKTQHRQIISAKNSTVNGEIPNTSRSAKEFTDGWRDLDFEGTGGLRPYADGHQSECPCGSYLHVPLAGYGVDGDHRVFRVRSRVEPGDLIWCRENGWERPFRTATDMREGADTWEKFYYDADGLTESDRDDFKRWRFKRRHSTQMPKWASRCRLRVLSVRPERVQDISEEDARAEGIRMFDNSGMYAGRRGPGRKVTPWWTAREAFTDLWDTRHGSGAWLRNDWVWLYEFEKVEP